ncbi:site-specific DNA-methyltransferase [Nocardioides agariphilus]|uniref:Site-specific DNA-methyltransferase n=1 Tax=Nocardioides agariphilus TaxID=433664 RepID=A0A930VN37_9ACTN|nr:site-specific DNA-methyltransferase [Nocardioides agariphilus]MBF4768631.1 site-specific DNA-methyltransferase [Nocardioides agariphilus]
MDELDDLELLSKDELIDLLRERAEVGVKLTFPGKAMSRRITRRVRPRVQRTIAKYGAGSGEERSKNLLIEGDNLQALATLYRERGHVDLILTDPPYNTGGDWRYNDKWDEDPNDPGIGDLVNADDTARHTKWMKFMYPRLLLMKQMLKPGGVLAICIDHRELFHLGQMLDELFDDRNRLAIINWERSSTKRNDKGGVSTSTEFILVYAKDKERARTGRVDRTEIQDAGYKNPDNDPNGRWYGAAADAPGRADHAGMYYGIQSPFTGQLYYPTGSKHWSNEKRVLRKMLEGWGTQYAEVDIHDGNPKALLLNGAQNPLVSDPAKDPVVVAAREAAQERRKADNWPQIVFTRGGDGKPRKKVYLEQLKKGVVPSTYWADDDYDEPVDIGCTSWDSEESGTSEAGARELNAIVGSGHGFETVKPIKLFQKVIQLWCPLDGTVADPFAGSGTTGHAVLALNAAMGADRRFILIEQGRPEKGDSYARTLTADRLQRVVAGNWANGKGSSLGEGYEFRTLTKQVDATALLAMEREEMVDTVIASYFDSSRRRGASLIRFAEHDYAYLVAKNADDEGFYLVWGGVGENTDLTEEVYEACVEEGEKEGLKPVYHIYSRFNLFTTPGVHWYQIPDRILADFGLDVRTESYTDGED